VGVHSNLIQAKLDNFGALGIDGARLVTAFPQVIGNAPRTVALVVATLSEGRCWDQVRDRWNEGHDLGPLVTPLESLLLFLGKNPEAFQARPQRAATFVRR